MSYIYLKIVYLSFNIMHTSLQIENNSIPIYYVEGASQDPIVLVFSSIFGLTTAVEDLCEEISYFGASVVAVNLFWQQGGAAFEESQITLALNRKNQIPLRLRVVRKPRQLYYLNKTNLFVHLFYLGKF